jgi:hypothetical protein
MLHSNMYDDTHIRLPQAFAVLNVLFYVLDMLHRTICAELICSTFYCMPSNPDWEMYPLENASTSFT